MADDFFVFSVVLNFTILKGMKVFDWKELWDDFLENGVDPFFSDGAAMSIGCFDGPHKGHRILFDQVILNAKKGNLLAGLVTFVRPLPLKFARSYLGDISTLNQRLSFYEQEGFDFVVLIDFSDEFSKIEGTDFLTMLKDSCNLKFLAEGPDFHCGYRGLCKIEQIKLFAESNDVLASFPQLLLDNDERISSSWVRDCISKAQFDQVLRMLGRPFCLDLDGVPVRKSGNAYHFAKSCLTQVLPRDGVYNVFVNTSRRLRARLEVGSEEILVEPAANESSPIRIVEFINKE